MDGRFAQRAHDCALGRGPAGSHPRVRAWPWGYTGRRGAPAGWRPQRRLCRRGAWRGGGGRLAADHWSPLPHRYPPAGSGDRVAGQARPRRGESGPAPAGRDHALLRGVRADLHARSVAWRGSGPYQLPARRVGGNHGGRQRCARTTSRSHGLEGGVLRAGSALARDPACARALQAQHSFHGGGGCERGDATAHWRTRTASD